MELRNWAGNIRFSTDRVHHPETVGQVQEIVRDSRQVRVLGSRHSFNAIADSTGDLISLDRLEPVLEVDAQHRQVTIDGGVTYGRLAPPRPRSRLCAAQHRLAAAHHRGRRLRHRRRTARAIAMPSSARGLAAMEIVAGDGSVRRVSRAEHGDRFAGAVVGLGGLGVVTRLDAGRLADLRHVPGGVREPATRRGRRALRRGDVAWLQRQPVQRLARRAGSIRFGSRRSRPAARPRRPRQPSTGRRSPRPSFTRCQASTRPPARRSRAWSVRGTNACRTFAQSSSRATARSCRANTSCRAPTRRPRCGRSTASAARWRRCCRCRRCGRSRRTTSG